MTITAQEWVDRAIACGANPYIAIEGNGEWGLCVQYINTKTGERMDRAAYPGSCPDEIIDDVGDILLGMGRTSPQGGES